MIASILGMIIIRRESYFKPTSRLELLRLVNIVRTEHEAFSLW